MPLILIHPEDLFSRDEKEKLEIILSCGKCITFSETLGELEKRFATTLHKLK